MAQGLIRPVAMGLKVGLDVAGKLKLEVDGVWSCQPLHGVSQEGKK